MKKLIFAITCLFWVVQCSAEIIVVEPDGSGDHPTIQAAINAATDGDEVVLAIGTFTGYGNRDIDFLGKAITVRSTNPDDPNIVAATIIDCNGSRVELHRAFYFHSSEDANTILDGLTITNGYAQFGGGVYCEYSSPAITNCTFTGNSATYFGGAMHNHKSNPVVTNCVFIGNIAKSETLSTIEGGGAIYNYISNPTITNCTFTGNSAQLKSPPWRRSGGGAMYNCKSNPVVTNCTFNGNWARTEPEGGNGGAMYNYNSNPVITNCTFTGNMAKSGMAELGKGGAMYNYGSNPAITNCILWGNWPGQISSGGTVTFSNVQGGWGGVGNINKEPQFAFDTDFHLMPASPCIDAGDPNYIPGPNETDLDGNPRITGGRIDMGAYELPAAPCIAVSDRKITFIKNRPQGLEKLLQIRNCGPGELKWKLTEACPWLGVSPKKGTSSGQINEVTLTADAGGLSIGEYRCRITIADKKAVNSPVIIDIILHVGSLLHVPGEYSTIQAAIDAAGDWDTVLVADGVYKGDGNRDIDFKGKKIYLKSDNGAEVCIIDCNGSDAEEHRGFYFHNEEDADSVIDGLTITNGYAGGGGGIFCLDSSPTIINCIFTANAAYCGGAMYNIKSDSAITNCTFRDNSANAGGVMYNRVVSLTLSNCTFSGNSAVYGGVMFNANHNSVITSCTFSGNSAGDSGGAICNLRGNPVIANCILWGNGPQEISNYDSNAIITYSDVQGGWAGVGNIDIDPLFVDPCNGDYHLYEDSPCIDAGDPNYVAGPNETDLDGNPRVAGGRIDMGAYELQPLTPAELLLGLTDYLDELSLQSGTANSLRSKLEAALQLLEDGNENNEAAAVNLLEAFINAVRAQSGKKIPAAEAEALIEIAEEIITLLGN